MKEGDAGEDCGCLIPGDPEVVYSRASVVADAARGRPWA